MAGTSRSVDGGHQRNCGGKGGVDGGGDGDGGDSGGSGGDRERIRSTRTSVRIPGVAMRPVTQQTALSNIRKAYAIFRGRKQMGQRYLWTEEQLLLGERSVVLGRSPRLPTLKNGDRGRSVSLAWERPAPWRRSLGIARVALSSSTNIWTMTCFRES